MALPEFEFPTNFYGANRDAFVSKSPQVMLAGPADTGKTYTLLSKLCWVASKYPGASIVIARKQLTDVYSTVLVTLRKKVIPSGFPMRIYGGDKAQWFDWHNGSRLWVAGLDKATKILSAEHDLIYVNQAEELALTDWEYLTTRTTGRAGNTPWSQTIGDCNPGPPTHWIQQRAREGGLELYESTHRDNPEIYDPETGALTPSGEQRLEALRELTGHRLLRLFHGLWAAPEGAIYDVFDDVKHVVKAFEPPLSWPRMVGIDPFGAEIAVLWLAFDPQARVLNVYREYNQAFGLTTAQHAENVLRLSQRETIFAWVCGARSERAWRLEWEAAGVPVIEPPISDVWVGIDRVYRLLREFGLVIHDNCMGLISEIGDYRRKLDRQGHATDNIEAKERYHGLDALRYVVAWIMQPSDEIEVSYRPKLIGRQW